MMKMQVSILRGWPPQGVASRRAAPKKALVPMHARSSVVKVCDEGPHCDIMSICTPFCLLKSALTELINELYQLYQLYEIANGFSYHH